MSHLGLLLGLLLASPLTWQIPTAHADDPAPSSEFAQTRKPAETPERPEAPERRSSKTAKAKGEITFDDLKFEIERDGLFKRDMLTKEIEALNKEQVRIRGYILPASVFKQSGFNEFVLVRDDMSCCFGPGAMLYDCIIVQMEKGKTADFSIRPIAVKGKFEIKECKYPDSEEHYAIFKITASEAK
jgi:hypothetical protein